MSPQVRRRAAFWAIWISLAAGTASTLFLAKDGYERVLMAISWGAITITAVDTYFTADVRVEQDTDTAEIKDACPACGK